MAIETQRLKLRKFELSDAEAVLKFSSHPEVSRYTGDAGKVMNLDQAKNLIINVWHSDYEKYGYGRLALIDKQSDQVIGFCGLKYLEDFKMTDLGYRMLPEFWGRGYATESSRAVLEYAKDKMNFSELMAMAAVENKASQNVLLKLGFKETGRKELDSLMAIIYQLLF